MQEIWKESAPCPDISTWQGVWCDPATMGERFRAHLNMGEAFRVDVPKLSPGTDIVVEGKFPPACRISYWGIYPLSRSPSNGAEGEIDQDLRETIRSSDRRLCHGGTVQEK